MEEAHSCPLISSHFQSSRKSIPDRADQPSNADSNQQSYEVLEEELDTKFKGDRSSFAEEYALFFGLFVTSIISSMLVVADQRHWILSSSLYDFVENNRATTQIVIQLLSNSFGFFQTTMLCSLINQATRLHFSKSKASLNDLRFWTKLCTPSISWRLPLRYLLPLLMFWGLTRIPSALWAGALSPVATSKLHTSTVLIPSYHNSSLIYEYPSEFGSAAQKGEVINMKGAFAYNVGIAMQGALLSTASTATTVDGSPRKHFKLDNSGFTYVGRSYGVGAPAGLTDDNILHDTFTTSYTYQETAYNANVKCIYNSSTKFFLFPDDAGPPLFQAKGLLPNSVGDEVSEYVGWSDASIVAIGVASVQTNGTQYLGIAAGSNYASLNTMQCSIDYIPTLFNITVNVEGKDITVVPVSGSEDINPAGNIAHTATRQFELISNDQTNLYQSHLGNSFMSSIWDYNISQANSSVPLSEATATLAGLTNSVSAMLDDMLVAYASAQLMVGNQSTITETVVTKAALRVGNSVYIFAMFALNLVVLMAVFEEAIRTMLWKGLGKWNYMDIGMVIVSSWKGGRNSAETLDDVGGEIMNQMSRLHSWSKKDRANVENISGKTLVKLDGEADALVLDYAKEA